MKHSWNKEKAKKVKTEHKVEFEKMVDVFDDILRLTLLMKSIQPMMKPAMP